MCRLGKSTNSICIHLISYQLQLEPCMFISYYLTSSRYYKCPVLMNLDKGHNVFVNSAKFFCLFLLFCQSHEPPQLVHLHLFFHTHDYITMSRICKGLKNTLRILIKKIKRRRKISIQIVNDSSSSLCNVRAHNSFITKKM